MASRRDLIQSFQFAARRVVSAVVMRQTDPVEWPNRRLGGAGFGALMVTVIALAAVGIYGVVVPGGKTSWKDGRSIIVVKETGAPYVYLNNKLHPVLNFASAALLVGNTTVTLASSRSLEGVPRGVELGIDGAPMTLPKAADLVSPPWSLCSQQVPDEAGRKVSRTRLVVSRKPGQGFRPAERALLVTDTADGTQWLIWHDQRYQLMDPKVDRIALGLDRGVDVTVGDAWLKTLGAGENIRVRNVPGAGQPSTRLPGAKLGELVDVQSTDKGTQHYLVDVDGLKPISDLQYQIQVTNGSPVHAMSSSDVARANPASPPSASATQPPSTVPDLVGGVPSDTVVCSAYADDSFSPQVLVNSAIPADGGIPTNEVGANGATRVADRIWVPPGKAALVESLPGPDAQDGPLSLVTDTGRRYAIPTTDALRALGLAGAGVHPSKLPASLVVRIPEGQPLDPVAARAALQQEQQAN